jgi:hypothetical protein
MSLPNSKAHRASAAENPKASANTAQRTGHGRWLRTIMRGALIDIRRRKSFQRIAVSESKRGRSIAASAVANVS